MAAIRGLRVVPGGERGPQGAGQDLDLAAEPLEMTPERLSAEVA
jgi:hypothetical protein